MAEIKILGEKITLGQKDFNPLDASQFWRPYRDNPMQRRDCLPFHADYPDLLKNCETLAYLIRSYTVWEMTCGALGHPGGSFSEAEFLAVFFNYVLRFNPAEPQVARCATCSICRSATPRPRSTPRWRSTATSRCSGSSLRRLGIRAGVAPRLPGDARHRGQWRLAGADPRRGGRPGTGHPPTRAGSLRPHGLRDDG